ncbi:MAG: hypothetical protein AAF431_08395 [Pseudomonadota bacterium]
MSIYVIPALIALLLKLYILLLAHNSKSSHIFFGLIIVFALHNLSEVAAYIQYYNGILPEILLRSYYAATFCLLSYMCLYAIEVSGLASLKRLMIPITIWIAGSCAMVFATDLIVAGSQPIGYAITAIKGPSYWVFSLSSIACLVFTCSVLIHAYRKAESHKIQVQSLYTLFAMAPIVLLGFLLIPLMSIGVEINAAGALPICTTLFLLITLQSESRHMVSDVRRFLPFSKERRTAKQVQNLISQYSMDEISYKELATEFEKIAITHKLEQAGESVSEAAKMMQIKRTTLYSMVDRHGLRKNN